MMKIGGFKADDQDTLAEETQQNEEAVKVSISRNADDVDGSAVSVDGKSLDEERLKVINGELHDESVAEVKLDERGSK